MVSFIFKKVRTQLLPWPVRYLMCYHGFFLISIPIGGTVLHFETLSWIWFDIPDQKTVALAQALHFSTPRWLSCISMRMYMYFLDALGTMTLFLEQQAFCFAQFVLYVPVRGDVWIYRSLVVWPAMYDLLPKCLKGFILCSLLLVLSNFLGDSWHSCYETVHHDLYIFSDILFCLALC